MTTTIYKPAGFKNLIEEDLIKLGIEANVIQGITSMYIIVFKNIQDMNLCKLSGRYLNEKNNGLITGVVEDEKNN